VRHQTPSLIRYRFGRHSWRRRRALSLAPASNRRPDKTDARQDRR
jgi:hypothetical protein